MDGLTVVHGDGGAERSQAHAAVRLPPRCAGEATPLIATAVLESFSDASHISGPHVRRHPRLAYHPRMVVNAQPMPMSADAHRRAFTQLLAVHQGLLRKLAWGFGGDPADRADLLQDMATQLWAGFPRWDPARPFATWAYRVALNVALARRRVAAPPTVPSDELHGHAVDDTARAPEDDLLLHQLRRAIDGLDPLNRALLLLHLDDVGHREIGEILGLSESNVGVRLHRLKQRLRAQWETPR